MMTPSTHDLLAAHLRDARAIVTALSVNQGDADANRLTPDVVADLAAAAARSLTLASNLISPPAEPEHPPTDLQRLVLDVVAALAADGPVPVGDVVDAVAQRAPALHDGAHGRRRIVRAVQTLARTGWLRLLDDDTVTLEPAP